MSNPPPFPPPGDYPPGQPPYDVYQAPPPAGNVASLVRLLSIFHFVMAGLDGAFGLVLIAMAVFMPAMMQKLTAGTPGATPFPTWFFSVLYGGEAVVSVGVGIVKLIAGFKLKSRGRGAWGWALAAAIIGCVQLWCSILCILPMGLGIFTMVVIFRQDARAYLQGVESPAAPGM